MHVLPELFDNNRRWAAEIQRRDPDFFYTLSQQQAPKYLWIGCSDSRVPANQIVDLPPGALFVHRNVANLVHYTDLNCLSVLQYAIEMLKVEHVIVCGHYGCGGVHAVIEACDHGLIDNWLHPLKDFAQHHARLLNVLPDTEQRVNRLCELNVIEQVAHVCDTTIVRHAWRQGQPLTVHGWIYALQDGLLRDLGFCVQSAAEVAPQYRQALARLE